MNILSITSFVMAIVTGLVLIFIMGRIAKSEWGGGDRVSLALSLFVCLCGLSITVLGVIGLMLTFSGR